MNSNSGTRKDHLKLAKRGLRKGLTTALEPIPMSKAKRNQLWIIMLFGNAQQPMRNLAIAQALEQEGMVARAWFVLCAHDDNPDVQKHWKSWSELLPDPTMAPMLPASVIIEVGEAEEHNAWAGWMRERYRLGKVR